jgi:hypothetical protein
LIAFVALHFVRTQGLEIFRIAKGEYRIGGDKVFLEWEEA